MTFLLQIVKPPAPAYRRQAQRGPAGHAPVKMLINGCLILQCLSRSISNIFLPEEQAKYSLFGTHLDDFLQSFRRHPRITIYRFLQMTSRESLPAKKDILSSWIVPAI